MMQNELALHSKEALEQHFAAVWEVMSSGIERGITTEGVLPGKLRVPPRRRAAPDAGEPGQHQQRPDGGG
jgi:L-serine dehydratase